MGTPIPDVIDPGNDCPACTPPAGILWPPGETPQFIYVYFAGIARCPLAIRNPPNGQTFKLSQVPGFGCVWSGGGAGFQIAYNASFGAPRKSQIVVISAISGLAHFSSVSDPCPEECHVFTNQNPGCAFPVGGTGGIAIIHWMGIALHLITWMSLPSASRIMLEVFPVDDDLVVYKFCLPEHSMNVKIKTQY